MSNNSTRKLTIKCLLNSLFLILVSMSMSMPFSLLKIKNIEVYYSLIMLVIYGIFLYQLCWKTGWDDIGKVKREVEKENLFRGFISCFLGTLPGTIPLIIRIFNQDIPLVNLINGVMNYGFAGFSFNERDTYILIVYLIFIVVSGAAYYLGYKEISLYQLTVYTKKKEK